MEVWEADGEADFSTQVSADGMVEIESKLDFEPYRGIPALPRYAFIVLVGLIPLTGLGLLLWFTTRQPVGRRIRR
jgi:hypothetical protein